MLARVTWFFHWGPRDAWSLSWTELAWWHDQAVAIAKELQPKKTK